MNKQYFDYNEINDYDKLCLFNDKTGLFVGVVKMPEKHYFDASAATIDGRDCIIELKSREAVLTDKMTVSGHNFNDEDLLIDNDKVADVLLEAICFGYEPLFINFLEDGHTVIHNLLHLKKRPKRYIRHSSISKGYEEKQVRNRQGIYLCDAAIYNADGQLIKKPLN